MSRRISSFFTYARPTTRAPQRVSSFSPCSGRLLLGYRVEVRVTRPVRDSQLFDDTLRDASPHNRNGLLRGSNTCHVVCNPLGVHTLSLARLSDSVGDLARELDVIRVDLGGSIGLLARGVLLVQLRQHLNHVGVVDATLHCESDSVGTSDTVVLGSHVWLLSVLGECPLLSLWQLLV